jgi:8-oxo-dGTP pyrophosphatase MutT (NUDIX family)
MSDLLSPFPNVPIHDAATVILLRDTDMGPRVLMGQRGHSAVFMPGKFVFPGGRVDAEDYDTSAPLTVDDICAQRLKQDCAPALVQALLVAAYRELREETGLLLMDRSPAQFIFRAVTPLKRPRRFDARFFLCDAAQVEDDLDDFSRAEDELSHLQWVSLEQALELDLPFVTRLVLAEVRAILASGQGPKFVPFYDSRSAVGRLRSLT